MRYLAKSQLRIYTDIPLCFENKFILLDKNIYNFDFIYPLPKVITQFVKNWVFPNAQNIVQFKTSRYLLLAFGILS